MESIKATGTANIKLPGHKHTDAIIKTHQAADCIETKLTWPDGFEIEYKIIAGSIDFKTNGILTIENENEYSIIYPVSRKD